MGRLETFPRQLTKAVKPEPELTRPQIPRSAAPKVPQKGISLVLPKHDFSAHA